MLKTAICDDEQDLCSQLEGFLYKAAKVLDKEIEVDVFNSGDGLIHYMNQGHNYDVLFLDIEMGDISGIDVGKWLREVAENEQTKIVYVSWEKGYAMDLFQVRPMNFLIKPLTQEAVDDVLESIYRLVDDDSWFYYTVKNVTNRIKSNDIYYFESQNRVIRVITSEGVITFYGKLKEIIDKVDANGFWQIHQSYIVNYDHVDFFEYEQVTMAGNKVIPISQSRRKDIRVRQMTRQGISDLNAH